MLFFLNQIYIKYCNKQFPCLQSQVTAETSGQTKQCEGNEFLPLEREAPPCHLKALPGHWFFHPKMVAISRVITRKKSLPCQLAPKPRILSPPCCPRCHPSSLSCSDLSLEPLVHPTLQRASSVPELARPGSLAPA